MLNASSTRHRYTVHSDDDRRAMLAEMGLTKIEDLLSVVPAHLRMKRDLTIEGGQSPVELDRTVRRFAAGCESSLSMLSFLGAGVYDHFIHPAVDAIAGRGEILTSYTSYQPSLSQGLLQILFDYQTMVSRLTGLPVTNCSCYDGATALADAAWMACQATGRRTVAVSEGVWWRHRSVLQTYLHPRSVELIPVKADPKKGTLDLSDLARVAREVFPAAILTQTPNCFGTLEDIAQFSAICRDSDVVSVVSFNPLLSGVFDSPGSLGADIVCAEGQVLGLPMHAGGPGLGILACREDYAGYITGRIVGDLGPRTPGGRYRFVAQHREQHESREAATGNICTNQTLCAVRATIHLSLLGEDGLADLANQNLKLGHLLAEKLTSIPGVSNAVSGAFFNEFLLKLPVPARSLLQGLREERIFGGVDGAVFGREMEVLIAVTETKSISDIERFARAFSAVIRRETGR